MCPPLASLAPRPGRPIAGPLGPFAPPPRARGARAPVPRPEPGRRGAPPVRRCAAAPPGLTSPPAPLAVLRPPPGHRPARSSPAPRRLDPARRRRRPSPRLPVGVARRSAPLLPAPAGSAPRRPIFGLIRRRRAALASDPADDRPRGTDAWVPR
nr:WW domain-binding protein 11-like [Aegilops tauschii subsp. strangulata]